MEPSYFDLKIKNILMDGVSIKFIYPLNYHHLNFLNDSLAYSWSKHFFGLLPLSNLPQKINLIDYFSFVLYCIFTFDIMLAFSPQ